MALRVACIILLVGEREGISVERNALRQKGKHLE